MKNLVLIICVTLALGVGASITSHAQSVVSANAVGFGVDSEDPGMYCNVEKAEVCAITIDEEDCTKLNGTKVEACPDAKKKEK